MTQKFDIGTLHCLCAPSMRKDNVAYILYPMDMLSHWIEHASAKYGTNIVVITGMDWQNVFSPWPATGVPKGSPDFKGESPAFLTTLQHDVLPKVESALGIDASAQRTLVGVSMSGLFALWQWAVCDTFHNIASLSGSFWYEGFVDWIGQKDFNKKTGKAFFLLGDQESKAKAFASVEQNTHAIVSMMKAEGVDVVFESVPGNHYADPIHRLDASFTAIYF